MEINNKFNIWEKVYVLEVGYSIFSIQIYKTHIEYELWDWTQNYYWYKEYQLSKEKSNIWFNI